MLADLITKHAKNGRAGLAGLSLGGYTSIYLAQKYPSIVSDDGLFVTGCGHSWPRPGSWRSRAIGMLMFAFNWTIMSLPRPLFNWLAKRRQLQVNIELYDAMKIGANYKLASTLAYALGESIELGGRGTWKERYESTQARTCIVAGAVDDWVGACSERGIQLRRGNPQSRSFKVEGMRHTWDVQDPELFAHGVKSWMERRAMLEEFISLD